MTANGVARALAGSIRSGSGWLVRCPVPSHGKGRGDLAPSLSIRDGDAGRLLVRCFAGCDPRDVLTGLRNLGLIEQLPAPRQQNRAPALSPVRLPVVQRTDLAPAWCQFWRTCRPVDPSSPAGRYLSGRACALPPADGDLRWHPAARHWPTGTSWPAMVGLITDAVTARPTSLHMTFLRPNGTGKAPIDRPKLYLPGHSKSHGVVRLWPDEEATAGLLVGEGIETALSGARAFAPAWACLDAANLASFPVLPGIEALTVAVDDDPAGRRAAGLCASRWSSAGHEARLWVP